MGKSQIYVPWPSRTSPLSADYRHGIIAISVLAMFSLMSTLGLGAYLGYRILYRKRQRLSQSQLSILLFNLMLADATQTIGYLLSLHWLRIDSIDVVSRVCFAQGFLLAVGNLSSALFASSIALYTFVFITFKFQLRNIWLYLFVVFLWAVAYGFAIWGAVRYPNHPFAPFGPACLISEANYVFIVWLHYFWIAVAELAAFILYGSLFVVIRIRIRRGVYAQARGAKALLISRLVFLYPALYAVCTAPLLSVPAIATSTGRNPSLAHLSASFALWTSIGWLDVAVYTLTRRFEPAKEMSQLSESDSIDPLDTFSPWWYSGKFFGVTTTTCEAVPVIPERRRGSRHRSTDELIEDASGFLVHTHTTVDVTSAPMELERVNAPARPSLSSKNGHNISVDLWSTKSNQEY